MPGAAGTLSAVPLPAAGETQQVHRPAQSVSLSLQGKLYVCVYKCEQCVRALNVLLSNESYPDFTVSLKCLNACSMSEFIVCTANSDHKQLVISICGAYYKYTIRMPIIGCSTQLGNDTITSHNDSLKLHCIKWKRQIYSWMFLHTVPFASVNPWTLCTFCLLTLL